MSGVAWHTKAGGRKFLMCGYGVTAIVILGATKADPMSFGAVALVVGGFMTGNAYVEGKHAHTPVPTRRDSSGIPVPDGQ